MTHLMTREDVDTSKGNNYEGQFVIIEPEFFKEEYRNAKSQLFYAMSGFGCDPEKLGGKVFGVFCEDGEFSHTRRECILGIASDKVIEEWKSLYGEPKTKEVK